MAQTKTMTQKLKKYILILSAIFAFTFVGLAEENNTNELPYEQVLGTLEDITIELPDKMPEFQSGIDGLIKFLSENTWYPIEALKNREQGRVIVQFVINTVGKVVDVEVIQSVSPALDAEAVRVVRSMPNWIPGEKDGQKVCVRYTLPVSFRFNEKPQRRFFRRR